MFVLSTHKKENNHIQLIDVRNKLQRDKGNVDNQKVRQTDRRFQVRHVWRNDLKHDIKLRAKLNYILTLNLVPKTIILAGLNNKSIQKEHTTPANLNVICHIEYLIVQERSQTKTVIFEKLLRLQERGFGESGCSLIYKIYLENDRGGYRLLLPWFGRIGSASSWRQIQISWAWCMIASVLAGNQGGTYPA